MSFVITNDKGRPVATATTREAAMIFAYRAVRRPVGVSVGWTPTGKLTVDGKWTGWEVTSVKTVAV